MVRTRPAQESGTNDKRAYAGLHYSLPKGMIDIEGVVGSGENLYTITISRHNEADRDARYRLVVGKNILFEDKNVFSVNDKGLLADSLSGNSQAKIGAVIDNLTDTVINVGKIYLKRPTGPLTGFAPPGETTAKQLKPFRVTFDPFCSSDVESAAYQMAAAGFKLTLDPSCTPGSSPAKGADSIVRTRPSVDDKNISRMGFYYRPLTTVQVRIRCDGDAAISVSKHISVPDPGALAVYSVSRGAFANRDHTVTIVDGEPRKVEHNYPSEAVAFTAIPLSVTAKLVKALDETPGLANLIWKPRPTPPEPNADIKAKQARLNAEEDRLKAEQDYLTQKKKTEDLKKQVEASRNQGTPPPTGFFLEAPVDQDALTKANAENIRLENELARERSKQTPTPPPIQPPLPPLPPQ